MEESNLQIKTGRQKSTLSGKSTPKNSPSFRKLNSIRTPRRDARTNAGRFHWIPGNRVVFWLLLIMLWAYIGFHIQSKWAHNNNNAEFVGYKSELGSITNPSQGMDLKVLTNALNSNNTIVSKGRSILKKLSGSLTRKPKRTPKRTSRSITERSSRTSVPSKPNNMDEEIPATNTTYGLLVGPFGKIEDNILAWSTEKRKGTCDRKGEFARIVWSRKFVLIFHELSMTGAPLSMMELATELLSCGGTVSAVVLSRKGGLMGELDRRGIKVLKDKAEFSYKTAKKADLVIAGSAVCASWIDQYLSHFAAGSSKIVWWIMENRREYFDRSKNMLNQVKMLLFLSDMQSKQWLAWCAEENIHLNTEPMIVPLSVNDELAFVAGIPCSLNSPSYTVEKMMERRLLLRVAVRKEMGLSDEDMLLMSLSSINPGKGQLLLLESARLIVEQGRHLNDSRGNTLMDEENQSGITIGRNRSAVDGIQHSRALLQEFQQIKVSKVSSNRQKRKHSRLGKPLSTRNRTNSATNSESPVIKKVSPKMRT
ncbi:hypothetical protein QJS10_CPA10g00501 [Acorus calamus]|uniref:Glycosyl transferase family 1 domain-containing protein n=1 Tax=Acorus calamus TaxID=4465 RepID=A0AAV9E0A9_ACOCL|nr:hypothetical protein QJS10_CPA10g00501 [Acorus calamus]